MKLRTPEDAKRKLKKLKKFVDESPTFDAFRTKLVGSYTWYLGDLTPEVFHRWTVADFHKFYIDNKK